MHESRRFCVMTVGRAGSTSLVQALERHADIAVPNKDLDCPDNELLHHRRGPRHMEAYARLTGSPVADEDALIAAFFRHNAGFAYAGFKSMPDRHRDVGAFLRRGDIRFITLVREDIASGAASFLLAMATGSWRRHGEPHPGRWRFVPEEHGGFVAGNARYVRHATEQLVRVPGAIALTYEALCRPDFHDEALDAFFGRPIRIDDPRPPTTGASYIENWDEFRDFVASALRRSA